MRQAGHIVVAWRMQRIAASDRARSDDPGSRRHRARSHRGEWGDVDLSRASTDSPAGFARRSMKRSCMASPANECCETATSSPSISAPSLADITAIRPGPIQSARFRREATRLLDVTEESLYARHRRRQPAGNRLGAIGHAIEAVRYRPRLRHGAGIWRTWHRPADVGRTACRQPWRSKRRRSACEQG